MENIKRWFKNDYENYDITEYDGHLEARTNTVLYMIVKPHSGTDNRWYLSVWPSIRYLQELVRIFIFGIWRNNTINSGFHERKGR